MKSSSWLIGVCGLMTLPLAVACGGSDTEPKGGSKPTTVSTSIPDDAKANELTEAQTEELCAAALDAGKAVFSSPEFKAAVCGYVNYRSFSELGDRKQCDDSYKECLEAPAEYDGSKPGTCTLPASTCTATVGELEKCWSDLFAASTSAFAEEPSCDDIGKERQPEGSGSPASCESLRQKCPEAIDGVTGPDLSGVTHPKASGSSPSAGG